MDKLKDLRKLMEREKIDTYVITKFDPHKTEYGAEYWNAVKFISGFTGSAGMVVITKDDAGLWTDGRYFIQAENQIQGTGIKLHKIGEPTTKDIFSYVKDETKEGGVVAFDGRTLFVTEANKLEQKLKTKNIKIRTDIDLIGEIWEERAAQGKNEIYEHEIKFAGKERSEKIQEIRKKMKEDGAEIYIISSTDDIAWLFNLRGNDIPNHTTFASFTVITENEVTLYVDSEKIYKVKEKLEKENIIIQEYDEIYDHLNKIEKTKNVLINPGCTNYYMYKKLEGTNIIEKEVDITTDLKAIKNEIELKNIENVNIRDGIAMVKFIKWSKENAGNITELDADEKISEFRKQGDNFLFESFDTIAGYMANAAMMHYKATKDSCSRVEAKGMLLVDSGGNYLDGTTDITRTFAVGEVTEEMKEDFTLVLKAHIGIATAIFLYGATGSNLDILARRHMWDRGIDYKSGTGHGIGYCLNVHEGPHGIRMSPVNEIKLEKGMLITNEPGIYRKDEHGIRTENTVLVVEKEQTQFGTFLKFETISYCPIELKLVKVEMLSEEEKEWLNSYHKTVYEKLSPLLNEEEKAWLQSETKSI